MKLTNQNREQEFGTNQNQRNRREKELIQDREDSITVVRALLMLINCLYSLTDIILSDGNQNKTNGDPKQTETLSQVQ